MKSVVIWEALQTLRGGWQFIIRLTFKTVKEKDAHTLALLKVFYILIRWVSVNAIEIAGDLQGIASIKNFQRVPQNCTSSNKWITMRVQTAWGNAEFHLLLQDLLSGFPPPTATVPGSFDNDCGCFNLAFKLSNIQGPIVMYDNIIELRKIQKQNFPSLLIMSAD